MDIAMNATDLGKLLQVTPRRIRQLNEEGRLIRHGRGLFDSSHAVLSSCGQKALGQDRARGVDASVLAAVGWLAGFRADKALITAEDLYAWRKSCIRWRFSENEGNALLLQAAALLGDRAPAFNL